MRGGGGVSIASLRCIRFHLFNIDLNSKIVNKYDTFLFDYLISDSNTKSEMRSFMSNENIHKKEGWSYYVVSANKASSVTLQSPGNETRGNKLQFANFK